MQGSPLAQLMMQYLQQVAQPGQSAMNSQGLYPPGHFYPDRMGPQPGEDLASILRRRFAVPPQPGQPGTYPDESRPQIPMVQPGKNI
jgi:hypothetical protein